MSTNKLFFLKVFNGFSNLNCFTFGRPKLQSFLCSFESILNLSCVCLFVCVCVCLLRFCYQGNTPQYLSQMKSELHETFRICSWGSPEMVQHVKDNPVLQVSSQEPSTSSKYDFEDEGVLEALLNMLES